jgi:DNA primase
VSQLDWDAIKTRHRIGEVARRSGLDVGDHGRVMVCCPTPGHDDSTPSTLIDLDRDRYHCFGCGAHGDIIDWVKDIEGVDTPAAVSILDSGQPINAVLAARTTRRRRPARPLDTPQLDRTRSQRVIAANTAAWAYYSYGTLHQRGVGHLTERALDVTALESELGARVVGHTPSSKTRIDGLVAHLTGRDFNETELIDAGLATRLPDGCVIDFFRDRVILPITATTGEVIGLLGRDVTGRSAVKYLNPPTTASYHKTAALYRPSHPRLQPDASVVLCEGPLDALAIAANAAATSLSGHYAPVAACGTALSDHQIGLILALHPRAPVLAADGDQPGRRVNLEWVGRMLARGRESVITDWPDGYDPASWLAARGASGLLAVTRRGCLDDHSGALRPRHCGAAIVEAAFPDHDRYHPPSRAELAGAISAATAPLLPSARRRYAAASRQAFDLPVDARARASPFPAAPGLPTPPPERITL